MTRSVNVRLPSERDSGIFQAWSQKTCSKRGGLYHLPRVREAKPKKSAVEAPRYVPGVQKGEISSVFWREGIPWPGKGGGTTQYMALSAPCRRLFWRKVPQVQLSADSLPHLSRLQSREARQPEACKKCQQRPWPASYGDVSSSLHGTVYAVREESDSRPCLRKLPYAQGSHNISFGGCLRLVGNPVDKDGRLLSKDGRKSLRKEMREKVCYQCHIKSLTLERYEIGRPRQTERQGSPRRGRANHRNLEKEGILTKASFLERSSSIRGPAHRGDLLSHVQFRTSTPGRGLPF